MLETTPMYRVFYSNTIESMHFREKEEQSFKKEDIKEVVSTLQAIVKRQQSDEIRAIYGCAPYHLSNAYKKFEVEAVKWHAMETKNRMKHVANFRKYSLSLEEHFNKPVKSGRKSNESKRRRKKDADIVIDRMEKTKKVQRVEDPNAEQPIAYELFFQSMVPRLVQRCQGTCGVKLCTADEGDY